MEDSLKLSKREHFAGLAMQGIIAGQHFSNIGSSNVPDFVAKHALLIADAMMEALDGPTLSFEDFIEVYRHGHQTHLDGDDSNEGEIAYEAYLIGRGESAGYEIFREPTNNLIEG